MALMDGAKLTTILKRDALGRVTLPREQREALLMNSNAADCLPLALLVPQRATTKISGQRRVQLTDNIASFLQGREWLRASFAKGRSFDAKPIRRC